MMGRKKRGRADSQQAGNREEGRQKLPKLPDEVLEWVLPDERPLTEMCLSPLLLTEAFGLLGSDVR